LLKNKAIFINLANKGKAKNGRRISLASNTLAVSSSPSPAPANCSEDPNESVTVGCDVNWKRPAGAKAKKRKIDESDFRQKKLKLLEKSNNDTALRIAEAPRANNIQDKLASINQNKSDRLFMFQSLDDCPDEEAREFFLLRQKDIVDCVRNPTQSTACSFSRTQATSHPPEPSSETNGSRDVDADSSNEGTSIHQSNPQSEGQSESNLPWLDPDLACFFLILCLLLINFFYVLLFFLPIPVCACFFPNAWVFFAHTFRVFVFDLISLPHLLLFPFLFFTTPIVLFLCSSSHVFSSHFSL
jgi:hypothetical protein